jgi:predicted SnoaL-like aldol condensation-catalyzing enzyme
MLNLSVSLSEKKSAATGFLTQVAAGEVRAAYERFIAPDFIHHNPYFKGDRASLMAGMEDAGRRNPAKTIEIMKVLEEGDTVMTFSRVRPKPDDLGVAVVHLFRFEGTKIAELWDLGQPISGDSINENGVF